MKIRWFLWVVILAFVSACAPAANSVDDVTRLGAAVARNYGDDVARAARLAAVKPAVQSSDEYARMISSSLDDLLQNQPVDELAQQFAGVSDDVLRRAPTAIDYVPPQVVYNAPRSQWSRLQQGVADEIGSRLGLNAEKAGLFLQTTCWVTDYVKLYGEYPSENYSLLYIHMQAILNQMQPDQQEWAELTGQVVEFIQEWADEQGEASLQEAGQILFDGMCLINEQAGD